MRPVLLAGVFTLLAATVTAEPVRLYWDPNTESDLAGYQLVWGPSEDAFNASTVIPKDAVTIEVNLQPGTYVFALKAFNSGGQYSGLSNRVTVTVIANTPTLTSIRVPIP